MMMQGKLKNQGYTMVEVIIVMAITVVVTGMFFLGISVLNSKPVDECAHKLQIALENNRVTTMGKLSANICIYKDSNGYVWVKESIDGNIKDTRIGEQSVEIDYILSDGSTNDLPTGGLIISFDRGSGSLKPQSGGSDDGKYVQTIIVSRAEKRLDIKIDKLTGRISVN